MNNRIILKGDPLQKEDTCTDAVIKPGMLLALTATGVRPHNVANLPDSPRFARERDVASGGVNNDYAVNDTVLYVVGRMGDELHAILKEGQNVARGAKLTSNGDGTLKAAANNHVVIVTALEAVNAASADARIRVEVTHGFAGIT